MKKNLKNFRPRFWIEHLEFGKLKEFTSELDSVMQKITENKIFKQIQLLMYV